MSLRRKEQTSNSAIKNLIKALGLEEKLLILEIEKIWKNMMGDVINKHTLKMFIDKKVLFIQLNSASLRNELNYNQAAILSEIIKKTHTKYINKIKFI
ncbi:DUF721 domain-containing protein [Apibacter adventoris]|uniref:DUF721 domain-containing protein n=1 Tax=Apibacter adventoris TaxID=1679466 RepID=UPI000CF6C343|nr:DUF721 domain-containing protein [Apibacter adventoris]PQL96035.1 hypothetical protein C4S76_00655 [Apibacter adventoris]